MSQIISVKRVANNSLQGELTDSVQVSARMNVLAHLNKGDERFRTGSIRHAWFPVTLMSLKELGVNAAQIAAIEKLQEGEKYTLNIVDPTIEGEVLTVQVTESINPDDYQTQNALKAAKQLPITKEVADNKNLTTEFDLSKYVGETGYFVDKEGNLIFSKTTIAVKSQVKHTTVPATLVPSSQLAEYGATLAEPTKVASKETANA